MLQRETQALFDITINSSSEINVFLCHEYFRQGQFCGSYVTGYAPPVYSYSLSCVSCTTSNWAKYIAVSLLPVTAFFIFVIMFRLARPYKKYIFNVTDAFFLAMLATFSITFLPLGFGQPLRILQSLNSINLPLIVIAIMYSFVLAAYCMV